MRPRTAISDKAPATIAQSPEAVKVWKRVIALYKETTAMLITAFDADLLAKYCGAEAELIELAGRRKKMGEEADKHMGLLSRMKPTKDTLHDYFSALAQANALQARFQSLDARIDSKRKMLLAMAQSLYLTPRSRTGASPQSKEPEKPVDDMSRLLDE